MTSKSSTKLTARDYDIVAALLKSPLDARQLLQEVLASFVFWDLELGGDFILHNSIFEGSSGDHEGDLLVAA